VVVAEIEVVGVWSQTEGIFFKTKIRSIHGST
jgi:hypothetical protein